MSMAYNTADFILQGKVATLIRWGEHQRIHDVACKN